MLDVILVNDPLNVFVMSKLPTKYACGGHKVGDFIFRIVEETYFDGIGADNGEIVYCQKKRVMIHHKDFSKKKLEELQGLYVLVGGQVDILHYYADNRLDDQIETRKDLFIDCAKLLRQI